MLLRKTDQPDQSERRTPQRCGTRGLSVAKRDLRDAPAEFSGWLVEPGTNSLLPVFMEVRVQDHTIPAGGHDCLFPVTQSQQNTHVIHTGGYTSYSAQYSLKSLTHIHTLREEQLTVFPPTASITSRHGQLTANHSS